MRSFCNAFFLRKRCSKNLNRQAFFLFSTINTTLFFLKYLYNSHLQQDCMCFGCLICQMLTNPEVQEIFLNEFGLSDE